MKASVKAKRGRAPKRDLFAELSEGMTALAEARREIHRDPECALTGDRLQRPCARPGRPRDPALLLHGAGRLERAAADRPQPRALARQRLAQGGRAEVRYVYRRALSRAVGLIGIPVRSYRLDGEFCFLEPQSLFVFSGQPL